MASRVSEAEYIFKHHLTNVTKQKPTCNNKLPVRQWPPVDNLLVEHLEHLAHRDHQVPDLHLDIPTGISYS